MTQPPLVSVIMIFLNAEPFIEAAIESVLAQTYRHWELLLVDDGSTDGSTELACGYVERHVGQVRYLTHAGFENRGMSASRNLGLRHARGEYIAFLDADDVWLPHALDKAVSLLAARPEAGMVYAATQFWYSWTGQPEDQGRDYRDFGPSRGVVPNTLVQPPALVTRYLLDGAAVPCMCSLLVRRQVVQDIGGFEENFRGMYEDQAFYAKVGLKSAVWVADECWARYRQHPRSSCAIAQATGQHGAARLFYLNWLGAYLTEHGVKDRNVWQALHDQQWRYRHPRLHRVLQRLSSLRRLVGLPPGGPFGKVRFGSLRRVTPISRHFGFDRGQPIDRYYIERFLDRYDHLIQGRVLEVGDNFYTRKFGGHRVIISDVLHVTAGHPQATIVADLTQADHIPANTFDCIILTQTLHLIYDVPAAIQTLQRILKPGGVLLATFPGISPIDRGEWREQWYWAFTSRSAQRLFEAVFLPANVQVEAHGNVMTAVAFLHGLAAEELHPSEFDHHDPAYEVLLTLVAVKEAGAC